MQKLAGLVSFLGLVATSFAQSNAVNGLDVRIHDVVDVTVSGRRGTHPNGEVGFGVGHAFCNSGTVAVPWLPYGPGQVMLDTCPKIAFLIARERDGRMVQVSDRSFLKHSRTALNFTTGPCAPCVNLGGPFLFVGCSDTNTSSSNGSRNDLGPASEVDPWLGTWSAQGSYLDRGDPVVPGAAAVDGVQSLSATQQGAFDAVQNRIAVRESELVGGGDYFAQAHLVVQGEPVANRGDNAVSRACAIAWDGASWSANVTGTPLAGSVLRQWVGAMVQEGGNGEDDGRFAVASRVTGPVNGLWHYEYALHNLDNSRGGGRVRIPVDAGIAVSNFGFRDLDTDAQNQWVFTRTANEIVVTAAPGNELEWNTIYNVWFDCPIAPLYGYLAVDQARPGPGAAAVEVATDVPSAIPSARAQTLGQPCGGCANSFHEWFAAATRFDLSNRSVALRLAGASYLATMDAATWIAPAGTALAIGDDEEVAVTLPFAMAYPGGTTGSLRVCSNGYVSVGVGNGAAFQPSTATFVRGAARWAAAWHDLDPSSGGQVLVDANATRTVISFVGVPNYGTSGTVTFQYQFFANGETNLVWQSMAMPSGAALVGFSPGFGAIDSGSRDLSNATAFAMCAGVFGGMELRCSARPILGTSITLALSGVPAQAQWAAVALSLQQAMPAIDLTPVGMEGCYGHLIGGSSYFYVDPTTVSSSSLVVPNDSALMAAVFVAQGAAWAPPLTTMGAIVSNGQWLMLGR